MYLDDVDYNFKGNKDNYWCCEKCQTSCIEQIRYGKSFKEMWHIENNDIVKDCEIKKDFNLKHLYIFFQEIVETICPFKRKKRTDKKL